MKYYFDQMCFQHFIKKKMSLPPSLPQPKTRSESLIVVGANRPIPP